MRASTRFFIKISKMIKLNLSYIAILAFSLISCTTENINLSPVSSPADLKDDIAAYSFDDKKRVIVYSSEITNLISSFPKLKNDAVNREFVRLSSYLKEYIAALEAKEVRRQKRALKNVEQSYKSLQKLRPYLTKSDDEVLNRYLVRIKTNLSRLQSATAQDTTIAPK